MDTWTSDQVVEWLSEMGFQSVVKSFRENDITGDVLIHADHEMLKDMDITSVGQRITLLKAIFNAKIAHGVPIEEDDYVPETATIQTQSLGIKDGSRFNKRKSRLPAEDYTRLELMVKERDKMIEKLNTDVTRLSAELTRLKDDLMPVWPLVAEYKAFGQKTEAKKKSVQAKAKPAPPGPIKPSASPANIPGRPSPPKSPTKLTSASSSTSANVLSSPGTGNSPANSSPSPSSRQNLGEVGTGAIRVYGDKGLNRENESYKSFQVSLGDPCSKILPAALRKYKINDDWQQYALYMKFDGQERALAPHERPLQLRNELKTDTETPVFLLKQIKARTPITRADGSLEALSEVTSSAITVAGGNAQSKTSDQPSIAIAIYKYKADREDEFDVEVGDRFRIIGRETGWCIVERDGVQGWVPSGCLHETEEDLDENPAPSSKPAGSKSGGQAGEVGEIMTPQRGVVLYDYVSNNSPNELSIKKGDELIITKKYQHWLLADYKDQKGWVPSCYVSLAEVIEPARE
ncbi:ras association (RalGDS/AF-6) domain-containing protein [Cladochytrium replicatum]|nr:ras association (RalGDS/AF-6) domain-containing protein [Cladochytrium replicatum]